MAVPSITLAEQIPPCWHGLGVQACWCAPPPVSGWLTAVSQKCPGVLPLLTYPGWQVQDHSWQLLPGVGTQSPWTVPRLDSGHSQAGPAKAVEHLHLVVVVVTPRTVVSTLRHSPPFWHVLESQPPAGGGGGVGVQTPKTIVPVQGAELEPVVEVALPHCDCGIVWATPLITCWSQVAPLKPSRQLHIASWNRSAHEPPAAQHGGLSDKQSSTRSCSSQWVPKVCAWHVHVYP